MILTGVLSEQKRIPAMIKGSGSGSLSERGKELRTYLALFLILLVVFAVQSYRTGKEKREKLQKTIHDAWGKLAVRKYKEAEWNRIVRFFELRKNAGDLVVDDITWNDLSMDEMFKAMNQTYSSVGEECLYRKLRTLNHHKEELENFGKKTAAMENMEEKTKELLEIYASIGNLRSVSLYQFILEAEKLKPKSNAGHYTKILLLALSVAGLFFAPQYAIFLLVGMLCVNIYSYYRERSDVNNYTICLEYMISMIRYGEEIGKKLEEIDGRAFGGEIEKIRRLLKETKGMTKGMFLIGSSGVDDSIVEMVMQYVRMIFHVDLIKFNLMVRKIAKNLPYLKELYDILGECEAAAAVASFRVYLKTEYQNYGIPEFCSNGRICCEKIYHPLIPHAVKNSLENEHSVLLTGSNASGKSTFLKTVALNVIFAQTIDTVTADAFSLPLCEIYSSMALKDDLANSNSYYMVEIKSLKRILDRAECKVPVICFVDEVLRGTNTIERIAASTQILKALTEDRVICFAATHDIELTYLLEDRYHNYHFSEDITKEDVKFNYQLKKGRTTTRNAIRLLDTLGYPAKIVADAKMLAEKFENTGKWNAGNN